MKYVGHAVRNPKTDLKTSILQGRATAVIHGQHHSDQWTDPGPSHTPQQRSRRLAWSYGKEWGSTWQSRRRWQVTGNCAWICLFNCIFMCLQHLTCTHWSEVEHWSRCWPCTVWGSRTVEAGPWWYESLLLPGQISQVKGLGTGPTLAPGTRHGQTWSQSTVWLQRWDRRIDWRRSSLSDWRWLLGVFWCREVRLHQHLWQSRVQLKSQARSPHWLSPDNDKNNIYRWHECFNNIIRVNRKDTLKCWKEKMIRTN